jgi:ubiquinone/menaquinone biosynthesis C-methylase UbiE
MKIDVVKKTIETYEQMADLYNSLYPDVNKENIDFFIYKLHGDKILDIGCGSGRDAEYFVNKGLDVIGIDLSNRFIEISQDRVPKAKFIKMDMRNINFPVNSFDGIWLMASILHIPKLEVKDTIIKFREVLKTNGIIYLSVKLGEGERFVKKDRYKGLEKFFAFYTESEISDLLKDCSFEIIKLSLYKVPKQDTWIDVFAIKK